MTPRPPIQVRTLQPLPDAPMRLFCFPYAGGDGSLYSTWPGALAPAVEVCVIDLPGRAPLFAHPPFRALPALLDQLTPTIQPYLDRPFVFFGYSMGALLSFELAHALRAQGAFQPRALFVAAHRAPDLPDPRPPIHNLPDTEFVDYLRTLQGTPPAVLEHAELMALLMPLLRADFTLCETYHFLARPLLDLPIYVFGGRDDSEVAEAELCAWSHHTTQHCTITLLTGHHFFLQESGAALLASLRTRIEQLGT